MRDLRSRRHAFVIRGADEVRKPIYQALRAIRNAAAIGAVLGVGNSAVFDVVDHIEEGLTRRDYALEAVEEGAEASVPPVVLAAADVAVLRDVARAVRDALRDGLDEALRPRGRIGARITDDIEHNGELAVFERDAGGLIALTGGRLTVNDLLLVLDDVVVGLDEAVARGLDVELLDDPGYPVIYYGDTPEARR